MKLSLVRMALLGTGVLVVALARSVGAVPWGVAFGPDTSANSAALGFEAYTVSIPGLVVTGPVRELTFGTGSNGDRGFAMVLSSADGASARPGRAVSHIKVPGQIRIPSDFTR
jgi:hypothetical protein